MNFVKVNYHLNQNYYVEDVAFLQVAKKAITNVKNIKFISGKVQLDELANSFNLFLTVEKDSQTTYVESCENIQATIEEYSYLLLARKPKNIQIVFKEKNER